MEKRLTPVARIEAHGYTVLHFWNNDVIENIEGVLEDTRLDLLNAGNR